MGEKKLNMEETIEKERLKEYLFLAAIFPLLNIKFCEWRKQLCNKSFIKLSSTGLYLLEAFLLTTSSQQTHDGYPLLNIYLGMKLPKMVIIKGSTQQRKYNPNISGKKALDHSMRTRGIGKMKLILISNFSPCFSPGKKLCVIFELATFMLNSSERGISLLVLTIIFPNY